MNTQRAGDPGASLPSGGRGGSAPARRDKDVTIRIPNDSMLTEPLCHEFQMLTGDERVLAAESWAKTFTEKIQDRFPHIWLKLEQHDSTRIVCRVWREEDGNGKLDFAIKAANVAMRETVANLRNVEGF